MGRLILLNGLNHGKIRRIHDFIANGKAGTFHLISFPAVGTDKVHDFHIIPIALETVGVTGRAIKILRPPLFRQNPCYL
jgi:hypothetical protein